MAKKREQDREQQNTAAVSERRVGILQRTAKEVRNHRVMVRLLSLVLTMLIFLVGTIYVVSILYKRSGTLTISLDKYEMTQFGLSLSESREMTHMTSHLNAKISEKMTNISEKSISPNVGMIDGEHNGRDYIAYTFYLQNAGEVPVSYEYSVVMSNITNGIDEAIRLRLYVDGTPTTYAKTKTDGSGPEPFTTSFYSSTVMAYGRVDDFAVGQKTKFTVVIWIEGTDPECLDWLIGGQMKIDMNMSIVH